MLTSTRRKFLGSVGVLGGVIGSLAFWSKKSRALDRIKISIAGPNVSAGHHKFDPDQTLASTKQHGIVIAGGGVAGLSAGWWLKKSGFTDFVILELEHDAGGNARAKSNEISPYPLGAHYIPMPGPEAVYLRTLFEDMGIIKGYDAAALAIIDEFAACHTPKERLLSQGVWQESIIPALGVQQTELDQIQAFQEFATSFAGKKGTDGRYAFASPAALSSKDPEFTKFDGMSVQELLNSKGMDSKHLAWYLNYCCRDDFGSNLEKTSAWALLHYFNARHGNGGEIVTWPDGIGHVVSYLTDYLKDHLITGAAVKDISQNKHETKTVYQLSEKGSFGAPIDSYAFESKAVICALPQFVCASVIAERRQQRPKFLDAFSYSPWLVANIKINDIKALAAGVPVSWDNVSQNSHSLGYVVANHQTLNAVPGPVNITYYLPVTEIEPHVARAALFDMPLESWRNHIVKDLSAMHPTIAGSIEAIEIWLWPHGMIRPTPGFITSTDRQEALKPLGRIHFAHSDLSGMSLFEEAQYQGVQAAIKALQRSRHEV